MAARPLVLTAAFALLAALTACIQDDGTRFNPFSMRVSVASERAFGYEVDRAILEHLALIDDPVVLGFVNDLGQAIVALIEPQPFVYRFRLIRDPTLNAFAVAGGYIYLHTGTLLAAGRVGEFAGVLAHEIGHTKGRHWARMKEKTAVQNAVAQIAGLAAAVATGEPGVAVIAQGANVALQLRYSREFEVEADQLGVTFMTRAGYDARGLARFFERLLAVRDREPLVIPPYLYTHPEVEGRVASVTAEAGRIARGLGKRPDLDGAFERAQARLALLLGTGRATLITAPAFDRARGEPLLREAGRLRGAGDLAGAIARLRKAEALEPADPRTPFLLAEALEEAGREGEALASYRRTLTLDPTRAQVYFRSGRLYAQRGERHQAVYYLEQAARRAGPTSDLRRRAEAMVERLTFPVLTQAGLADGRTGDDADTVAGFAREVFGPDDTRVVWWGKVGPRFRGRRDAIEVRWIDPDGRAVQEGPVETLRRPYVAASLEAPAFEPVRPGRWRVEALLENDVVDRRSFDVLAEAAGGPQP